MGGILLLVDQYHIDLFDYAWPLAIILVGIFLIARQRRTSSDPKCDLNRFKFIGDTVSDGYTGEIDGTDMSHFIGDVELDLTGAVFKPGDNRMILSSFIGDIRLELPADVAVKISCSSGFGDFTIFDRREGGMFHSSQYSSPGYDDAERRLSIRCTSFIGDVKVKGR